MKSLLDGEKSAAFMQQSLLTDNATNYLLWLQSIKLRKSRELLRKLRFKKSQVGAISIVLLVMIAIVSVVILWNVFGVLVSEKAGEVDISPLTTSLDIKEAIFFVNGASKITLYRPSGPGTLTSLKFVFYDDGGNSYVKTQENELISELETKTYNFDPGPIGKIQQISVIPVFKNKPGMEFKSNVNNALEVPKSLVSWWRFEDGNDFLGNNPCAVPAIVEDNIRGKVGNFNGMAIACGNDSSLDMNKETSIIFCIKTNKDGKIIKKGNNYEIDLINGKIVFSYGGNKRSGNIEINDENWHHVTASMLATYIDGNVDVAQEIPIGSGISQEPLLVGEIEGYIDEVMLFNESLSNNQVSAIYNNQK
jgi:hypothetical protein